MSSGNRTLVFNTRERALSADNNRAQRFIAADRALLMQRFYDDRRLSWIDSTNAAATQASGAAGTPLQADVYGGLMVVPGSSSCTVTPGTLGCVAPDPGTVTADDSPYLLINDAGVPTVGILNFVANAGGSARVDFIECRPAASVVLSDSRDIFNPVTGLFTPTSVPKVTTTVLEYRYRVGVAGSGVPALALGWLPIGAVVVSTTAISFVDCDFYDVRPLVEDRVRPGPVSYSEAAYHTIADADWRAYDDTGSCCVSGLAYSDYNGYLAGGKLRRATPSFTGTRSGTGKDDGDPNFINLENAENQDVGFSHTANHRNFLYAVFPLDLPRWVRYSQSAVSPFGRIPRGPRGIVVVSKLDSSLPGGGSPVLTLPVFGNASGVVLGLVKSNVGGTDFATGQGVGSWNYTSDPMSVSFDAPAAQVVNLFLSTTDNWPQFAKALKLGLLFAYKSTSGVERSTVTVDITKSGVVLQRVGVFSVDTIDTNPALLALTMEVPTPADGLNTTRGSYSVRFTIGAGNIAPLAGGSAQIIGWEMGHA